MDNDEQEPPPPPPSAPPVKQEKPFKERESDLLRELSALYTKLNQVREKRAKAEEETSAASASEENGTGTDGGGSVPRSRRRRVLLVTRSLPFTLIADESQAQWRAEFPEHVGLDAAMETYLSLHETHDCIWIGAVHGGATDASVQNTLREQLRAERNYFPIFLDPRRERLFYQGFCKTVLWPLFHSWPPTTEDHVVAQDMESELDDRHKMERMWQAYVAVNQVYADAVQQIYEEGDLVWIQGYHLALVPQMVQALLPNAQLRIGFFLHVPFPSSELYRILHYRDEILTGMLGADLLGFQTYEYARHFQSSAVRLLGLESSHRGVDVHGHFARVTICPVGIDSEKFAVLARSEAVGEQVRALQAQFAGKTVLLGVDPLDLTKGLVHKLLAVDELFTLQPELSREVVFVQIVTGTNGGVAGFASNYGGANGNGNGFGAIEQGTDEGRAGGGGSAPSSGSAWWQPSSSSSSVGGNGGSSSSTVAGFGTIAGGALATGGGPNGGLSSSMVGAGGGMGMGMGMGMGLGGNGGAGANSTGLLTGNGDAALGSQVEALVSRINSKLQDIGADAPVQYLTQELPVESLIALYAIADAIVTTPLRDGMNTIPFEYVVCREAVGQHARVVLSEFAGCAHSLSGATLVNPWNTEELQRALLTALDDSEQVLRAHQTMYSYVSTFTARHWAENFLEQLEECQDENPLAVSGRELSRRDMISAYSRSSRRLLFINYEGVLAAEASIPELSYPPQELIWQLDMLTKDPRNTVVLVSARSTSVCEQWFAGLSGRIVLAAEYGVYVKWCETPTPSQGQETEATEATGEPWRCMVPNLDLSWWEHVMPLLEYYTERTPGAFIERKDSSVAWHYRDCDLDHGLWQASELLTSLRELTRSLPVTAVPGNRYLEVRPQKVSKASLFERIWEFMNYATLFPEEVMTAQEEVTAAEGTGSSGGGDGGTATGAAAVAPAVVDTSYFGEAVKPIMSPLIKPREPVQAAASMDIGDVTNELVAFQLDGEASIGQAEALATHADGSGSSMATREPTPAPLMEQSVDFVLVIASGDDRTDEDLFAVLVPPPIDLEAYCRQLEKDQLLSDQSVAVASPTGVASEYDHAINARMVLSPTSSSSSSPTKRMGSPLALSPVATDQHDATSDRSVAMVRGGSGGSHNLRLTRRLSMRSTTSDDAEGGGSSGGGDTSTTLLHSPFAQQQQQQGQRTSPRLSFRKLMSRTASAASGLVAGIKSSTTSATLSSSSQLTRRSTTTAATMSPADGALVSATHPIPHRQSDPSLLSPNTEDITRAMLAIVNASPSTTTITSTNTSGVGTGRRGPSKTGVSVDAATMFPRALLATPTTARREAITETSKFTPRRDFPPSAALFKALQTRYGDAQGVMQHKLPDNPAACWALVCPPTTRAKLEDLTAALVASGSSGGAGGGTMVRKTSATSVSSGDRASPLTVEEESTATSEEDKVNVALSMATEASAVSTRDGDDEEEDRSAEEKRPQEEGTAETEHDELMMEDEQYLYPVNTFVCTLGRKLSQAPYYIKNSADLFQLLQEMGLTSHVRRQRQLSLGRLGRSGSLTDMDIEAEMEADMEEYGEDDLED